MDTMLYSEIIRRPVQLPGDKKRAKIVEVVARKGKTHWNAEEIMIESGFIDKEGAFYPTKMLSDISKDGDILIKRYEKGMDVPKIKEGIYLSNLMKKPVQDSRGKEVGKVYDFEIYVGREPWIVWKILINPTGLSPTKRRHRIPTKNVQKIQGDKIILSTAVKGGNE